MNGKSVKGIATLVPTVYKPENLFVQYLVSGDAMQVVVLNHNFNFGCFQFPPPSPEYEIKFDAGLV